MSDLKVEHLNGSFDVDPQFESDDGREQIKDLFQHVFEWWGKPYEYRKTKTYHPIKLSIWENTERFEEQILEFLPYHKEQPKLEIYPTDRGTTAVTIDTQEMWGDGCTVVGFYYFLWMFINCGADETAMYRTISRFFGDIESIDLYYLMKIDKLGNTQLTSGYDSGGRSSDLASQYDFPDEDEGLGFHREGLFKPFVPRVREK